MSRTHIRQRSCMRDRVLPRRSAVASRSCPICRLIGSESATCEIGLLLKTLSGCMCSLSLRTFIPVSSVLRRNMLRLRHTSALVPRRFDHSFQKISSALQRLEPEPQSEEPVEKERWRRRETIGVTFSDSELTVNCSELPVFTGHGLSFNEISLLTR